MCLFTVFLISGCTTNTYVEMNTESYSESISEINKELINKLESIDFLQNYQVKYVSESGKHVVHNKYVDYVVNDEEVISFNSNHYISAGAGKSFAENCTQSYSITSYNCECEILNMSNDLSENERLMSVDECSDYQTIKIEELNTKSELLVQIKNDISERNITYTYVEDENCYYNYTRNGYNMEKICLSNNDIISYSFDRSSLGVQNFKEWIFE